MPPTKNKKKAYKSFNPYFYSDDRADRLIKFHPVEQSVAYRGGEFKFVCSIGYFEHPGEQRETKPSVFAQLKFAETSWRKEKGKYGKHVAAMSLHNPGSRAGFLKPDEFLLFVDYNNAQDTIVENVVGAMMRSLLCFSINCMKKSRKIISNNNTRVAIFRDSSDWDSWGTHTITTLGMKGLWTDDDEKVLTSEWKKGYEAVAIAPMKTILNSCKKRKLNPSSKSQ